MLALQSIEKSGIIIPPGENQIIMVNENGYADTSDVFVNIAPLILQDTFLSISGTTQVIFPDFSLCGSES